MFEAGRSGKFEKMPPLRGSTKTGGQQLQICRAYGAADSTENGVLECAGRAERRRRFGADGRDRMFDPDVEIPAVRMSERRRRGIFVEALIH